MLLTDEQLKQVRTTLEAQAGLDEELVRRCSELVHLGAFDEAVRSAFVLLEERLRSATDQEGMTGTSLANYAFKENGILSRRVTHVPVEQQGLRELYSGAFKLFRNPTAHGVVNYTSTEGIAIIGLVNLLLGIIAQAEDVPAVGSFPENVEKRFSVYEGHIGPAAMGRLRTFYGRCVQAGLRLGTKQKYNIPLERHAYHKHTYWDRPKRHRVPVLYTSWMNSQNSPALTVPVEDYLAGVVGLDKDELLQTTLHLGFVPEGKTRNPKVCLKDHNDEVFFDDLWELITWLEEALDRSLEQEQ